MDTNKLKTETFLGIVIDNNDPRKLGRCKIKVFQVFDKLDTTDIPWAFPWKDLNGNEFTVPEVGKYVSVVFDQGNKYTPEYIYAQNYNINLEKKLQSLNGEDYTSMRAVLFDNKTQIYSNDSEGLIIDYKYNYINITNTNIDISLKDPYGQVTLGDSDASQQLILGTNFMQWFDEFLDVLLGSNGGPYFDSTGAPIVINPSLMRVIARYKSIRDQKLLSNNVFVTENYVISSNKSSTRQNGDQLGDVEGGAKTNTSFYPNYDSNNDANLGSGSDVVNSEIISKQFESDISSINSEFVGIVISPFAKSLLASARVEAKRGVIEVPKDSNTGTDVLKYQRATWLSGTGWAWCAAFVCWCCSEASKVSTHGFKLPRTAGAFDFENWARSNSKYGVQVIRSNNDIKPGDIIVFNFSHIGISNGIVNKNNLPTIEGNTSPGSVGSQRDGGGVYFRNRKTSLIRSIIRLP